MPTFDERVNTMTDTNQLQKMIRSSGYKECFIAQQLGITPQTLRNKLKRRSEFRAGEIMRLSELLNLSRTAKDAIFFARDVDK